LISPVQDLAFKKNEEFPRTARIKDSTCALISERLVAQTDAFHLLLAKVMNRGKDHPLTLICSTKLNRYRTHTTTSLIYI